MHPRPEPPGPIGVGFVAARSCMRFDSCEMRTQQLKHAAQPVPKAPNLIAGGKRRLAARPPVRATTEPQP